MGVNRKSFSGKSAGEARSAASDWLRNFKEHGPLEIKSVRVTEENAAFVATVSYAEMTVDETPRYFANYQPMLKSA